MTPSETVLSVGHVNWDVVLKATDIPNPDESSDITHSHANCGGSATNTAIALSNLSHNAHLAGRIGDDTPGRNVRNALSKTDVAPSLTTERDGSTTTIYCLITEGDDPRYLAHNESFTTQFSPDSLDSDTWREISHVHVTSFDTDIATEFATTAAEAGKTVSFNPTQEFSRKEFPGVIDVADIIIVNDREANILRDRYDFNQLQEETTIVVTHGADGSTAHTPSGDVHHGGYPISPDDIQDAVGAGDAFVGGFLSAWLRSRETSHDIAQALAVGNACGATAVTSTGPARSLDSWQINHALDPATKPDENPRH